jgi:hypothetical protein
MEGQQRNRSSRVLLYCRDVESHLQVSGMEEAEANLTGLLTAARPHGNLGFYDLQDWFYSTYREERELL